MSRNSSLIADHTHDDVAVQGPGDGTPARVNIGHYRYYFNSGSVKIF